MAFKYIRKLVNRSQILQKLVIICKQMSNASSSDQQGIAQNILNQNDSNSEFHEPLPFIQPDTVIELNKARERLRQFSVNIGNKAQSPIREDVFKHCDKVKQSKKQLYSFDKIDRMVKNRIQKMMKNKKIKRNWGNQDVSILIWVVSKYADQLKIKNVEKDLTPDDWHQISQLIPGVNRDICMFRWLSLKKNKLADNNWSNKQSLLLDKLVEKYGEDDWGIISQKLYKLSNSNNRVYRCPKQCREHWNCYLNPNLRKGPWQQQEDIILLQEIKKRSGQKKWTELVKYLNGRTQNALKNRYNLIIDKQKAAHNINRILTVDEQIAMIDSFLDRNYIEKLVNNISLPKNSQNVSKKNKYAKKQKIVQFVGEKRVLRKRKQKNQKQEEQQLPNQVFNKLDLQFATPRVEQNHIISLNTKDFSPHLSSLNFKSAQPLEEEISPIGEPDDTLTKLNMMEQFPSIKQKINFSQFPADLEKIKIITMNSNENAFQKLRHLIKKTQKNAFSFVPCVLRGDTFTKIDTKIDLP